MSRERFPLEGLWTRFRGGKVRQKFSKVSFFLPILLKNYFSFFNDNHFSINEKTYVLNRALLPFNFFKIGNSCKFYRTVLLSLSFQSWPATLPISFLSSKLNNTASSELAVRSQNSKQDGRKRATIPPRLRGGIAFLSSVEEKKRGRRGVAMTSVHPVWRNALELGRETARGDTGRG